ncbi:regulatory Fis family protein [Salsuginibacillus halophilus]|uniref:Regulatory Fis family protein n=1 Tax=Salsuginibacillus halophilus TaxID=517424 RepID=A0A2P8HHV0_9BACI|nr:sigma-54-dependent Fis family transcriptional regulator [Salsuginibacillus halophilus]PSL45806.1 regulatory Fis family protein [Salsuginibacillus halophilus]
MEIKVGVLAPYRGLKETVDRVASSWSSLHVEVVIADLTDAIQPALTLEKSGCQVLISRGGTASIIREHVTVPVVEIDVSGYDILRTLYLVKDSKETMELIGFPNVCHGLSEVSNLLETYIPYQTINRPQEVESAVISAANRGVQVVIGDTVTIKTAERFGLQGVMITSGQESVNQSFVQSYEMACEVRKQQKINESYENLLTKLVESVVIFEEDGRVLFANKSFRAFFLEGNDCVGSDLPKEVPKLKDCYSEVVSHEYIQTMLTVENQHFHVEGECLGEGIRQQYYLKLSNESRYAIEQPGLSVQPLRTELNSFSQLSLTDERIATVVEKAKEATGKVRLFLLQGEHGTGKRSFAAALHNHVKGYPENQWHVRLTAELDDFMCQRLIFMIKNTGGTFYIEGWEGLSRELAEKIVGAAQFGPSYCILAFHNYSRVPLWVWSYLGPQATLFLPPLRDRTNFLTDYIRSFIANFNTLYGKQIVGVDSEVLDKWWQSKWPGNLNELKDLVKQGVEKAESSFIKLDDLSEKGSSSSLPVDLSNTLAEIEKEVIERVLEEEEFNQSKTAKRLGINRSTLWRKLK